jgi:hypothetical protein
MKVILIKENEFQETYKFEYTDKELKDFKEEIIKLFTGKKYAHKYELVDIGDLIKFE